jgi:hypothetical protein
MLHSLVEAAGWYVIEPGLWMPHQELDRPVLSAGRRGSDDPRREELDRTLVPTEALSSPTNYRPRIDTCVDELLAIAQGKDGIYDPCVVRLTNKGQKALDFSSDLYVAKGFA